MTEPWGTPALVLKDEDDTPSTSTLIERFERNLLSHLVRPNASDLARRFLCQTWSKAFEMSKPITKVSLPVSSTLFHISALCARISPVDRNYLLFSSEMQGSVKRYRCFIFSVCLFVYSMTLKKGITLARRGRNSRKGWRLDAYR